MTVSLDHIACKLPKGHRLRVAASLCRCWKAARRGNFRPLRPPPRCESGRSAPNHLRRSETDQRSGTVSLIIEDDFGMAENLDHGMITGSIARERWDIHPDDPLSAKGFAHWAEEL